MKISRVFIYFCLALTLLIPLKNIYAWGKRGHETVGSLAAQLLAKEHKGSEFLSQHSYDMGFYNNVPDLVWKADSETYKKEFVQHFMDMEHYEKIKDLKWNKDRKSFFEKYPELDKKAGRSFWRVQELYEKLETLKKELRQGKKRTQDEQHQLQARWFVVAGTMGHYIADLAQPLHVTENYDGQLTQQKGLHHWFEEDIIDQLYPEIQTDIFLKAKSQWESFHKENKNISTFDLCLKLSKASQAQILTLTQLDKKVGRSSAKDVAPHYRELAIDRLSSGALYLAELWSRQTDWKYNGHKFFNFVVAPDYIEPEIEKSILQK